MLEKNVPIYFDDSTRNLEFRLHSLAEIDLHLIFIRVVFSQFVLFACAGRLRDPVARRDAELTDSAASFIIRKTSAQARNQAASKI